MWPGSPRLKARRWGTQERSSRARPARLRRRRTRSRRWASRSDGLRARRPCWSGSSWRGSSALAAQGTSYDPSGAPPPALGPRLPGLGLVTTSAPSARLAGHDGQGTGGRGLTPAAWPRMTRRLMLSGTYAAGTAAGVGLAVVTILVVIGWIAPPPLRPGLVGGLPTPAVPLLLRPPVAGPPPPPRPTSPPPP